jgi:hypothetical protein
MLGGPQPQSQVGASRREAQQPPAQAQRRHRHLKSRNPEPRGQRPRTSPRGGHMCPCSSGRDSLSLRTGVSGHRALRNGPVCTVPRRAQLAPTTQLPCLPSAQRRADAPSVTASTFCMASCPRQGITSTSGRGGVDLVQVAQKPYLN